jgi:mannuronan synthase
MTVRTPRLSRPAARPVRSPRYVPLDTGQPFIDQARYIPTFLEKWSPLVQIKIALYFAVCLCMLMLLPNSIYSPELREITYVIGLLGVWRYGWWFNHFARAKIYEKIAYPRTAARAKEVWDSGWRPRHVHIQMTTFPATLWLGSSELADEIKIANHLKIVGADCDITLKIIRQNQPGKRVAIALILRAMSRAMVPKDDLVVFMDGDFVIHSGNFARCFPLFAIDPGLHALTTNEEVIVKGVWWMAPWLNMRFAQRRLAMQSHALSGRVLTLTGRMSVFRAEHIIKHEFIRLQEADYLNHWLWGTFRFLSGDDKSTWYTLLKYGVRMTYVPDANGTTIEVVEGSGYRRMVENLRRWSGNMLRNGARAIALGPTKMPFFIWWCLIDQRLAMWTMLFSPILAIAGAMKIGWAFLGAYVVYIAVTRMMLSMVLWTYAREVDINYVWTLYSNQLLNAAVKVYMLWRLSKQRWANRGNQTQGMGGQTLLSRAKDWMAVYLTAISFGALFLTVMLYTELLTIPTAGFVKAVFLGY